MLLVVDDEDLPCRVTARMLMTAGYRVLTAASGDEALQILENERSRPVRLVITDVRMPGMGGPELAERLRERPAAPPVLFVSGGASPRTVDALPGPYLAKPFSEEDLLWQVHQLLGDD